VPVAAMFYIDWDIQAMDQFGYNWMTTTQIEDLP